MKPFLLLATRAEDLPADEEYALFLRYTGLSEEHLVRRRLEAEPLGDIDLDDWSGIFVGGGPFNASDPPERKSGVQRRVEAEISTLLDAVIARDFPFFGACYGIGTVGAHEGAVIDGTHREPISVVEVARTAAGAADPLLANLPDTFAAFVGHKEAITILPPSATLLVRGEACPVQMYRYGSNVYVTQFHPELDIESLGQRMQIYRNAGYFHPDDFDILIEMARNSGVREYPHLLLRNFVTRYATD